MRIRTPSTRELLMHSNLMEEGRLVASCAVEVNDHTVMYGCIRVLPELALFCAPNASKQEQAIALRAIFREARRVLKNIGQEEAILFADSEDRASMFDRHFGASPVDKITMTIGV